MGLEGADWGEAHLNDVRFNSNWVFFTNDDCLKVDIQFQKCLFNSENCKLSCGEKWWYWQISEMGGETSKKNFSIAPYGV